MVEGLGDDGSGGVPGRPDVSLGQTSVDPGDYFSEAGGSAFFFDDSYRSNVIVLNSIEDQDESLGESI